MHQDSTGGTIGEHALPPVVFSLSEYLRFDQLMDVRTAELVTLYGDPNAPQERPAATAWRFRRHQPRRDREDER